MSSPVLFLIFNRPDQTRAVFERIRSARPARLFVAADGPRETRKNEQLLCQRARETVTSHIDWPCDVQTLFREKNLGCRTGVNSAISWFFDHVEEGIILEDDCLPDPSFFRFCEELLETYKNDEQVMMISGFNLFDEEFTRNSYFFSRYGCIWGWATWRRAWKLYDLEMKNWPNYRDSRVMEAFLSGRSLAKRIALFDACISNQISTWDLQWTFSRWRNNGASIVPRKNLVQNIGATGVHMKPYDPCLVATCTPVSFPLKHPEDREINITFDRAWERHVNRGPIQVLLLICKYLVRCHRQRKNVWREIQEIASCLKKEIRLRISVR